MSSIEYHHRESPAVVILINDAGQTQQVLLADFEGKEATYTTAHFGPPVPPPPTAEEKLATAESRLKALEDALVAKAVISTAEIDAAEPVKP